MTTYVAGTAHEIGDLVASFTKPDFLRKPTRSCNPVQAVYRTLYPLQALTVHIRAFSQSINQSINQYI